MLVLFDVNETVLDMRVVDEVFGDAATRTAWFDLLIRTALVTTAADSYRPFGELAAACALAVAPGVDPDRLRERMSRLPAHDDVAGGLTAVRDGGHRVVALGNSAREVIETQLAAAGVRALFDDVRSADDVGALKPAPTPYLAAAAGLQVGRVVLVAAHDWDVAGARTAGLRTVLLDRGLRPALPGLAPDATIASLHDLVGVLAALDSRAGGTDPEPASGGGNARDPR